MLTRQATYIEYLLNAFGRLLDFEVSRETKNPGVTELNEKISSEIRQNWETVGRNMQEAFNQYESEIEKRG
ncbi:MAG: hypothetical protein GY940_32295 [bacterium]|nr:hypothetical protein [bacterium]